MIEVSNLKLLAQCSLHGEYETHLGRDRERANTSTSLLREARTYLTLAEIRDLTYSQPSVRI